MVVSDGIINPMTLDILLAYSIGNNTIRGYLIAFGVLLVGLAVLRFIKHQALSRVRLWSRNSETELDDVLMDVVDNFDWLIFVPVAFYVSVQFIDLPGEVEAAITKIIFFVLIYYGVRAGMQLADFAATQLARREDQDETILDFLNKIVKLLLWVTAGLLVLSNLGYDISTLVAGLGVGGVAVAFALQSVLSDVFASISIHFDQPFKVGDFIVIGDDMGTVQRIGIKSTRLESLEGEELVVSNKELTDQRVHNYKRMEQRRIRFRFGVTYDTPPDKLREISKFVTELIKVHDLVNKVDRVHFKAFGDFSLNFEAMYTLSTGDYGAYMDVQEEINLSILEGFEKRGIEMAFPTQTIHLLNQADG